MALIKTIKNTRTGHLNEYWKLTGVAIDAHGGDMKVILSGYSNSEDRASGKHPDDSREWMLHGEAFTELLSLAPVGETVLEVIANACYGLISQARRPIPDDGITDEEGNVTLKTGEIVRVDKVERVGENSTIPSEFKDAVKN